MKQTSPTSLMSLMSLILFLTVFLVSFLPYGRCSPFPGMGSSALLSTNPGTFFSVYGFKMNAGPTGWILRSSPENSDLNLLAVYYPADKADLSLQNRSIANLVVRRDPSPGGASLNHYVKNWISDYSKLGFEVIQSGYIKPKTKINKSDRAVNDAVARSNLPVGYAVDLLNSKSKNKIRQFIFYRNQQAIVFTCRDQSDHFKATAKICNQIVTSFEWTQL